MSIDARMLEETFMQVGVRHKSMDGKMLLVVILMCISSFA